jgi:hypothetical protein
MILNAGNGKIIGSLLFMVSLMYGFLPIDLSHLTSTLGRDETVFYIIKLSCVTNINIIFYLIKLKKY